MSLDREQAGSKVRNKIIELAKELGNDARRLGDDDSIPGSGMLDSAGLLALIVWCEAEYGITLELDDLSLDNFGTIHLILDYLAARSENGRRHS
jgi:D-alanine--poly(phosphoribitol) ligase subunit 2